jgi:hypothetical protein
MDTVDCSKESFDPEKRFCSVFVNVETEIDQRHWLYPTAQNQLADGEVSPYPPC